MSGSLATHCAAGDGWGMVGCMWQACSVDRPQIGTVGACPVEMDDHGRVTKARSCKGGLRRSACDREPFDTIRALNAEAEQGGADCGWGPACDRATGVWLITCVGLWLWPWGAVVELPRVALADLGDATLAFLESLVKRGEL